MLDIVSHKPAVSHRPADAGIEVRCRLCESRGPHREFMVREMMLGTRDVFPYFQCTECGSLQIRGDLSGAALSRYYPSNYYSFSSAARARRWRAARDRMALDPRSAVGGMLLKLRPDRLLAVLRQVPIDPSERVVDVGCGSGLLLDRLAAAGFTNVSGVDPFIEADMMTSECVPIYKRTVEELTGPCDVVMFHHSLEHVPDPVATLQVVNALLAPGGRCIVRVPTVSSEAWDRYREDWVQIDAPRHVTIPSRRGLALMADHAGFALDRIVDDSWAFQFIGSEMYRRDAPLSSEKLGASLSRQEIAAYEKRSVELNGAGRGDQVAAIMRKV